MQYDDSVFSASAKPVESNVDIVNLSLLEYFRLSNGERAGLRIRAMRTSGLTELSSLRRRIAEYIQVRGFESRPTLLVDINRRFAKVCKTVGTRPTDEVAYLAEAGVILPLDFRRRTAYFPRTQWEYMSAQRAEPAFVEIQATLKPEQRMPPLLELLFSNLDE